MRKIKECDCGIARVEKGNFHAWSQCTNQTVWHLVENGYTFGKVAVETTREKKEDWTGLRKYRIITQNKFFISLRLGQDWYTLSDYFTNKSVKLFLSNMLDSPNFLWQLLVDQLSIKCLDAGVSEWQRMDIIYSDYDLKIKAIKLLNLLESV